MRRTATVWQLLDGTGRQLLGELRMARAAAREPPQAEPVRTVMAR